MGLITQAPVGYSTATGTPVYNDVYTGQATHGFVTAIRHKGVAVDKIYGVENYGSWDYDTEIDVYITDSIVLATVTESEIYDGLNFCLIANEPIRYKTVVSLGGSKYTIKDLLRGRRGDPTQVRRHTFVGEPFFKVDGAFGVMTVPTNLVGQTTTIRILNQDSPQNITSVIMSPYFGASGLALKPNKVVMTENLGNLIVSWERANRAPFHWIGTGDNANVEGINQYTFQVMNEVDEVVRTLTATSLTQITYTEAQQITDFGTAQEQLYFTLQQDGITLGSGMPKMGIRHLEPIMRTFFDTETTGAQAADTTKEWSTTNVTYNVDADDFLRMTVSTTAANKALKFDKKKWVRNSEVTAKVRVDTVGAGTAKNIARLIFRGYDTDETGLVFGFADDLSEVGFEEYVGGVNTELATASISDINTDVWYFVKVRVWENRIKAKVWATHLYEPGEWLIDYHYFPATRLTGWNGIGQRTLTVNTDFDMIKMEILDT